MSEALVLLVRVAPESGGSTAEGRRSRGLRLGLGFRAETLLESSGEEGRSFQAPNAYDGLNTSLQLHLNWIWYSNELYLRTASSEENLIQIKYPAFLGRES